MAAQIESETDVPVSTLLGGIVEDAKRLLNQQLTLFQVEIKNDIDRTLQAFVPLILGGMILMPALLLLGMAMSYGLCALFPALPLWGSFAIVGSVCGIMGTALVYSGYRSLESVKPTDSTLRGLKENIQWKTKN